MLQRNEAATDPDTIYAVIEYVCEDRSEKSVIQLMEYKATKISPTEPQWLHTLQCFIERFFNMRNISIRNQSIQVLSQVMETNRAAYEEEILERIVIPLFANVHQEGDASVRTSVGKLLIGFIAHCDTKRSLELLDIVEKICNRPFDKFTDEAKFVLKHDTESQHILTIIEELIRVSRRTSEIDEANTASNLTSNTFQVFVLKLYHLPASHAIKIFHILCNHLEKYYHKPLLLDTSILVRKKLFQWLLRLRANATYHVGHLDDSNVPRFSHHLSIELSDVNYRSAQVAGSTALPPAAQQAKISQTATQTTALAAQQIPPDISHSMHSIETLSTIPVRRMFKIITDCLKTETDWSVVQLVLYELPNVLQNKALLRGTDVDTFAGATINLVSTEDTAGGCLENNSFRLLSLSEQYKVARTRIEAISGTTKSALSEFQSLILSTISALIPHHQCLTPQTISRIIVHSLRPGLLSLNDAYICVHAFTIMLLEMLELMLRHLPDILLEMSKMSTTLNVAVPVLEFLSSKPLSPAGNRLTRLLIFAVSFPRQP